MSEDTFHLTRQDLRKSESRATMMHGLQNPSNSNVSTLKSVIDRNTDKAKDIDERKANLPLPDQPPTASDWNSVDLNKVNVGSGHEGSFSSETDSILRDPPTLASGVREVGSEVRKPTVAFDDVGRQGKDNLDDLPKDAQQR